FRHGNEVDELHDGANGGGRRCFANSIISSPPAIGVMIVRMRIKFANLFALAGVACVFALLLNGCGDQAKATSGKTGTMNIKPPPKELVAKIRSQRDFKDNAAPDPIVSLEEFFTGNEDLGSIGCNLTDHPGMQTFYTELKAIRSRPDVQGVFVAI